MTPRGHQRGVAAIVRSPQERVDALRARSTDRENHLIDEYRFGKIGRREFMRRAAVAGMALPAVGFLAAACGVQRDPLDEVDEPPAEQPQPGGGLRIGMQTPSGAMDPIAVNDQGGLTVLGQSGEYLIWSNQELLPEPRLAESWEPNDDGSVWTFKLREGVTFHNGNEMTADDVVATFDRIADPDVGSNALSALQGVLTTGNTKALDRYTVEFTLDAPNGNFPYTTSSDNYNAIILPKEYDGKWDRTFIGTGPWKLDSYRPGEGVSYVPYEQHWNPKRRANADTLRLDFYSNEQGLVLAFQGNHVDQVTQISVSGGKALLTDPTIITNELPSAAHRQIHLRTDQKPLDDKRVRQAIALLTNRIAIADGLLKTKCDIGNDSPFAPAFPSTSPDVPQREQDVAEARKLLEAAGHADGFTVRLETWQGFELPALAQVLQQDLRAGNISLQLRITDQGTYFGDATFGSSRWLDSTMGITEYGHRGVPNVFLDAPLKSKGTWNSAHFKNNEYDQLVTDYVAAVDLDAQRRAAKNIQEMLLDEVPILFTYFYYFLSGAKDYVSGVEMSAMGHADYSRAGRT